MKLSALNVVLCKNSQYVHEVCDLQMYFEYMAAVGWDMNTGCSVDVLFS